MRWFLVALSISLTGCVSLHTTLTNSEGKQASCNNEGYGLIGSMVTSSRHDDCVKRYEAAGFKQQ